jgi:hypothetical protein
MLRRFVGALVSVAACLCALEARAEGVDSMLRRAQAAIERGEVDPARDLGPLVRALRGAKGDRARDLISAVEKLGDYDGTSPAAVKAYLQREAGAALLEIAQGKAGWTVRSDALMALRTLNVPDDLLDRAIAIAAADTSKEASFFRSRAELLQSWKTSRPQAPAAAGPAADPAREARALAYLRRAGLRASQDQLADSARQADVGAVEALLDAGFSAKVTGRAGSMLTTATGLGCASDPGDVESRVRVVRALIAHGADVKAKDEVGNTVLIQAAQYCPLPVVQALAEAGADVNAVNKVGTRPLTVAFLGQNWDVAEYLVSRGARVKQADVDSVFFELPDDPKKRAIIQRATAK